MSEDTQRDMHHTELPMEDIELDMQDEHRIVTAIERLCRDLGLEVEELLTLAAELFEESPIEGQNEKYGHPGQDSLEE